MLATILVEGPLGFHTGYAGLFENGRGNTADAGIVVLQAIKLRHAVALGLFLVGSARQHEAIAHLADLRATPPVGKVDVVKSTS